MGRYVDLDKVTVWHCPRNIAQMREWAFGLPVEDVKPVVHAHWIIGGTHEYDEGATNVMHCSNCKALFRYQGRKQNINYCYKCGAVMEGIKNAKIHKHR